MPYTDEEKQLAYTIDSSCWTSYSGQSKEYKRRMDIRRTAALEQARAQLSEGSDGRPALCPSCPCGCGSDEGGTHEGGESREQKKEALDELIKRSVLWGVQFACAVTDAHGDPRSVLSMFSDTSIAKMVKNDLHITCKR